MTDTAPPPEPAEDPNALSNLKASVTAVVTELQGLVDDVQSHAGEIRTAAQTAADEVQAAVSTALDKLTTAVQTKVTEIQDKLAQAQA
jgi:hypothetical protein